MHSLSRYSRKLSVEAVYRTPNSVRAYIGTAKDCVSIALKPYLSVNRLKGQGAKGTLTVNYIGHTYVKDYQESILFTEKPTEEKIGEIPFWHLNETIERTDSDLTFVAATKYIIQNLTDKNGIILPFLVNQILDVRGEWDDVVKRFHSKLRRHELRLIRKYNYTYKVSHKEEDFQFFYREIYIPSMKDRHGDLAHITGYEEAYRLFEEGILFLVKRDNDYVSGGLCELKLEPGIVHFRFTGVLHADPQLIKEGAQGAAYHAVIHWSNQQGYDAVDFESTEPYLKKGILQHKRKWGVGVRFLPNANVHKRIWMKIHRNTPAINQFLKDNPCIIINDQDQFQGLFFSDDPENVSAKKEQEWTKLCSMPGINGYQVRSIEDFLD